MGTTLNAQRRRWLEVELNVLSADGVQVHLDDGDGVFDAATDLPVPDDQGNIIEMHFGVGAEAQAGGEVSL